MAESETFPGADPRKYVQLATQLREHIKDGTLRPGDPAPSITTLAAERGGWARQTCAKAFRMLADEGLLLRVPGLGYFIADPAGMVSGQPPILCVAALLEARREDELYCL